jgi:hypothetical protein
MPNPGRLAPAWDATGCVGCPALPRRVMSSDQLPQDVFEFLSEYIGAVDELALLLTLMASTSRWWDAKTAGTEIGVSEARARTILERFASRNLLDIRVSDDIRYQFRPGTADLVGRAAATLTAYRERPAAVLRWVANRSSIVDFADAFRWRPR